MAKVRVHNFSVSVDGFGAGPGQELEAPLGVGGRDLHEWVFACRYGRRMQGADGGSEGVDNEFLEAGDVNIGATVMGRNMFGPVRGPWPDESWTGWWGPEPPYHHPVFVLTHHARTPLAMAGGTTFHFVTDGVESALEQALAAADGQDVRIGGGTATVQAYLRAGLIDELHIAVAPVLLGSGERLFGGVDAVAAGYEVVDVTPSEAVTHVRLRKAP